MDAKDEGAGGATNQSSTVVVKTEAACTGDDPQVTSSDLAKDEGDDTTECSSSFGDTCFGFEGEADGGELEVNSGSSAHANGVGSSKPPRKKVTAEWMNSVRPIMWRCQWLELRMKELASQVSKYDRELALIEKEKELQQTVGKLNVSASESMQIYKGHGNSIMKRRKRKRHEENTDTSFYIKKHLILSYFHDKQNKGAETDGVLIEEDCGSDGSIRGGLDTVTLLDSENYDMIFEQLTLKDTLMTIDGLQSRVQLLQDRLSRAHSGGENLALYEDNTDVNVRVPRKREHTQKRSFSYTKYRYTKPQKRKNLNILLKDDDGSAFVGWPALPDRETDSHVKNANRNAQERSGECNQTTEKSVTADQLLGTENIDDILIDNQAANEACQQFDNAKHLPSGTTSGGQKISSSAAMKHISALEEVNNTCGPVETDSTSAPAVEPVSTQNEQHLKPKKWKKGSFFTKKQRKEASNTPAAEDKTEGPPSAAKDKTGSTPSAAAEEKTESTRFAATGTGTKVYIRSAWRKRKISNEPTDAKNRESGSEFAASKELQAGKPSSQAKQKTENPSPATKKWETENAPSAARETEGVPLNLKIEKAVLVAVNSRRSQRVRKPKVFAE
ncbi:hypothetical protein HU200_039564 [Digitaria exilis]|uniref:Uncharacterized protein n=1 Tax=Digitaria exilis TaxID=1010633 RepID=A0A835BG85_9POAL|nr:hypothetical protein HU200_039564 [Digitaria exilis]